MRARIKGTDNIRAILDKVIGRIERQDPGKKEKVLEAYQKIVGEKASVHSRPVGIRRKILTIEVDSSTWLYDLNLKKRDIMAGLKKELAEYKIKDIRFRMGDIT